jgi:hypothetical protein
MHAHLDERMMISSLADQHPRSGWSMARIAETVGETFFQISTQKK